MEAVILILPLLLLGWLFLTSSRRQKAMRSFAASLDVGDKIVTSSGLYGTIRHLDESSAWLEVADGVTIRVDRRALSMKQADGTGASATTGALGALTDTSTDTPPGGHGSNETARADDRFTDDTYGDDLNGEGTSGNRAAGQ